MSDDRTPETVQIRRAPRIGVFIAIGIALGILTALVLTTVFPVDPNVGFGALFGYLALYTIPGWVVVTSMIAILLDRRASRRARTVTVVQEHPTE